MYKTRLAFFCLLLLGTIACAHDPYRMDNDHRWVLSQLKNIFDRRFVSEDEPLVTRDFGENPSSTQEAFIDQRFRDIYGSADQEAVGKECKSRGGCSWMQMELLARKSHNSRLVDKLLYVYDLIIEDRRQGFANANREIAGKLFMTVMRGYADGLDVR